MYKFDRWHLFSFHDKPYAMDIVKYCNNLDLRNNALEIGCGLGDIIRRLSFKHKKGFDLSPEVLKAAGLLSKISFSKVNFTVFDFLKDPLIGTFDLIICVNWIHAIEINLLKSKLQTIFQNNLSAGGKLIIDTAQGELYEYNHSIETLTKNIPCTIYKLGDYLNKREVFILTK
jgi:SAM-dependent methyltransferase